MNIEINKKNWTKVTFGQVVENTNETLRNPIESGIERYIGLEHLDNGELQISRFGNTEDGVTFTKLVKPGQTLFGKRRAYQRKVAVADFTAICSGDILTFTAKKELLLESFLPFIVTSEGFFENALSTSAGSLSPRTRWTDLAKFEFYLPPLNEQEDLSKFFWQMERHQQILQKQILSLDSYMETFLDNLKSDLFFKESSESFDIFELHQVADLNWGDMQTTKSAYQSAGYLTYSAAGPDGFMKTFDYDRDGIVVSAIGAECGKTWLASGKWSCIKNTMRIFSLDESKLAINYLYWITNSKKFWPKRGSAQPFISQEDARKLKLIVPSIEFQMKTLNAISEVLEVKKVILEELAMLIKFKTRIHSMIFELSEG
jgi:type I restriction enzyme S subunit